MMIIGSSARTASWQVRARRAVAGRRRDCSPCCGRPVARRCSSWPGSARGWRDPCFSTSRSNILSASLSVVHGGRTMKLAATPHERTVDLDISSNEFWSKSFEERDESFAILRRDAPVSWHPPTEFPFPHEEEGFWAVVRHEDINTVSRQTQRFGSRYGVSLDAATPPPPLSP